MKKTIALILILFVSQISIAQLDTKTKNKVRAKFEVAKQSYNNSDYSNTLVKIEEIETLLNGNSLPSLLNLKIKALVGNKQFIAAEQELEKLYEYELTSDIAKDIAIYEPIITKSIKKEKERLIKEKEEEREKNLKIELEKNQKILQSNPDKWKIQSIKILNQYQDIIEPSMAAFLCYNIGVMNFEQNNNEEALKYLKKSIEFGKLNSFYNEKRHSYVAHLILLKDAKIVDEMNSLGNSKEDIDKLKVLEEQRIKIFTSASIYLEKVLEINNKNEIAKNALISIYNFLKKTEEIERLNKL